MSEEQAISVEDLLDLELDDLEDLPAFEPYPEGYYKVDMTMSYKEVNKSTVVEMAFKLLEVLEVTDQEHPPAVGDTCSIIFKLDNQFGLGNLKKLATPVGEALGVKKIKEVVEVAKGIECLILAGKPRKDKDNPDRFYPNIKELAVV